MLTCRFCWHVESFVATCLHEVIKKLLALGISNGPMSNRTVAIWSSYQLPEPSIIFNLSVIRSSAATTLESCSDPSNSGAVPQRSSHCCFFSIKFLYFHKFLVILTFLIFEPLGLFKDKSHENHFHFGSCVVSFQVFGGLQLTMCSSYCFEPKELKTIQNFNVWIPLDEDFDATLLFGNKMEDGDMMRWK